MNDYTPKYFAKLSKNKTWYCSRSCGADGMGKEKQCNNLADVFTEMEEWAKSGIWYCHVKPLPASFQDQLTESGFRIYEYFGTIGISWSGAQFDGMEKFEIEKHLLHLESGDLVTGVLNYERLNFYMTSKTNARIGTSSYTINVVDAIINKELEPKNIQKKSYWD